jgi:hypothetical protein
VQRSAIAEGAKQPVLAATARCALLFIASGLINAGAKFIDAFGRQLHPKP